MSEAENFLMPYKALKSNLNVSFLSIEHESAVIKDIKDKSHEKITPDCLLKSQLMDLLYSCSINLDRVSEYLKSNQSVAGLRIRRQTPYVPREGNA